MTDRAVRPVGGAVAGELPGGRGARLTHVGRCDGLGVSWNGSHPHPDLDRRELRTELTWPVTAER